MVALDSSFYTWYTALQDTYSESSSEILAIVETIDTVQTTNIALQDSLSALAIGLSFSISIPDLKTVNEGAFRAGAIFNNAITQYPSVRKALFHSKTEDSKQYQIADLNDMLLKQTITLTDQIQAGLSIAESELDTFLASLLALDTLPDL